MKGYIHCAANDNCYTYAFTVGTHFKRMKCCKIHGAFRCKKLDGLTQHKDTKQDNEHKQEYLS